jgi:hypothetical protein
LDFQQLMLDQPLPEFGLQDSSFGNSATDIFFVSFDIAIEDTPGHSELDHHMKMPTPQAVSDGKLLIVEFVAFRVAAGWCSHHKE